MIDKITILCEIEGKPAHIPVYTTNENMIYGAFKILQANPDIPNVIKAIELNKDDVFICNLMEHYLKGE